MACSNHMILVHAASLIRISHADTQHVGLFQHLTMSHWFFGLCVEFLNIAPMVFLTFVL